MCLCVFLRYCQLADNFERRDNVRNNSLSARLTTDDTELTELHHYPHNIIVHLTSLSTSCHYLHHIIGYITPLYMYTSQHCVHHVIV